MYDHWNLRSCIPGKLGGFCSTCKERKGVGLSNLGEGLLGERELEYTERNDHNQAQPLRACITLMVYEPKLELFLSPRSGMTVGLTHVRGALKTGEVTVSIWRLNDIISELTGTSRKGDKYRESKKGLTHQDKPVSAGYLGEYISASGLVTMCTPASFSTMYMCLLVYSGTPCDEKSHLSRAYSKDQRKSVSSGKCEGEKCGEKDNNYEGEAR
ncbi:hypothetical protein FA13DRAFT_1710907 [Coprinellus micaceus]|uniref:Uncharacterized protein n=1 Tax=Coprinellus micaceus TaxID=71717 RepID=A0A4Y7T666_COPMI|nr:hypothetical protein FA13DRAFT_1710907 [Coprinellus micaceus]